MSVSHSLCMAEIMPKSWAVMAGSLWKNPFGQKFWREWAGGCMMSATYS